MKTLTDYILKIQKDGDFCACIVNYITYNPEWKGASMFEELSFEGMAYDEVSKCLYMPQLVLTRDLEVEELTCQCSPRKLCIHRAGLILSTDMMLRMKCYDWNTALQKYCEENGVQLQAPIRHVKPEPSVTKTPAEVLADRMLKLRREILI